MNAGTQYVEAGLNLRKCDRSLIWMSDRLVIADGTIQDSELDLYDNIIVKVVDLKVQRSAGGIFVPMLAGNDRDEFMRKIGLRLTLAHTTYPGPTGSRPQHNLHTFYHYDDLDQLVAVRSPDAGFTRFAHNSRGLGRFSQDEEQLLNFRF